MTIKNKHIKKLELKNKMLVEDVTRPQTKIDIKTENIMLLSTDPYYYKKFFFNDMYIDVYRNKPETKDYYRLFEINNNSYYIKHSMLDTNDNIKDFKDVVVEDVCFYKSVEIDNYYNLYKNLKVDVYKDVPDEELDKYNNIIPSFNGYYYIKNDMFI